MDFGIIVWDFLLYIKMRLDMEINNLKTEFKKVKNVRRY